MSDHPKLAALRAVIRLPIDPPHPNPYVNADRIADAILANMPLVLDAAVEAGELIPKHEYIDGIQCALWWRLPTPRPEEPT